MFIAKNYIPLRITWERIADALENIHRNLALAIRSKYCTLQQGETI